MKLGTTTINKAMFGNGEVSKAYLGSSVVYTKPTAGALPLDAFEGVMTAGASVASVNRRLLTSYTGALIRVKRTSDGGELDIGYGVDNLLDTAAISAFCTTANGVVVAVYDQKGTTNFTRGGAFLSAPIYLGATQQIVVDDQGNPTMDMQKAPYNFTAYSVRTFIIASSDGTLGSGDENGIVSNAGTYPRITRDGSVTGRQVIIAGGTEAEPVTTRWYLNGELETTTTGFGFQDLNGTLPNLRTNTHINGFLLNQSFVVGQLGGPNSFDIQHSGTISEVFMDTIEHTQSTMLGMHAALNRGYYA
jgi:hypothetical protein